MNGVEVTIALQDGPTYCEGGVVCSEIILPTGLLCNEGLANEECWPCEELPVGGSGLVLADAETNCLMYFVPVVDELAQCRGAVPADGVPVDFVLENALRSDCPQVHVENGYFEWCDDTRSCGCSQAEGDGIGLLSMMAFLGLLFFRSRT
ncbi:MAG: hypothetical protein JRF33_02020 [Deltaproteobacteria bacterium]|nr:hypothetical protein [Deltaproteobacteria bacterium]